MATLCKTVLALALSIAANTAADRATAAHSHLTPHLDPPGAATAATVAAGTEPPPPRTPHMLGVFGDRMVLQHDKPELNGCGAAPRSKIAALVSQGVVNASTPEVVRVLAGPDGCFVLKLAPRAAMTNASQAVVIGVKVSTGNASSPFFAIAKEVMYGIVVLCSGQSNMVHPLSYDYNATAQIAAAPLLPNLRLFQVGRQWSDTTGRSLPLGCHDVNTTPPLTPLCDVRNTWHPAVKAAANFSAVCYLTAQELMRTEWGVATAVGLVEADWGGSNEHTWQTHASALAHGCANYPDLPQGNCPLSEPQLSPIKGNNWGCLFHGMIEPLTTSLHPSMVLWYQGEADSPDPPQNYQCALEAMIMEWRAAFNNSVLPFFLVQLAPYWEPRCGPTHPPPCGIGNTYPATRIAQATATTNLVAGNPLAATGYCVTHDIGDIAGGIHPHNKTEVGRRLSFSIRTQVFGTPDLPQISAATSAFLSPQGNDVEIDVRFTAATAVLQWGATHNCSVCCTAETQVVEVCAVANCSDPTALWEPHPAVWKLATTGSGGVLRVTISQSSLLLKGVTAPTAARYAWSNFPECVLFDQNQLPVGPFNLTVKAA